MAAIISNFVVWPLFMASLLKSGKRERRSGAAGNGYGLALRGKAAFGYGHGVSANGNPVSGKKPVELVSPDTVVEICPL